MLLAGPRGRRLSLELARTMVEGTEAGQAYIHAAHMAAYGLDPGRGTSVVMLLSAGAPREEPEPPGPVTPDEVAALLGRVRLTSYDDDGLLAALVATVDSARYWQEPDGEDVLAAVPEMRAALERVGVGMIAGSVPAWWAAPLDRAAQWSVMFDLAREPTADGTARERLAHWREAELRQEAEAQVERPADVHANWSGHWWSTPPPELTGTTRSLGERGPVGLWLVEDGAGWDRAAAIPVPVPDDAVVLEIDEPAAWADLCRRFPLEVTASRRHDWYRVTGVDGAWVIPDWSRVAEAYDGVHVTVAGYLATAGRAVPVDDGCATVLAGWGPDETCWLTDAVRADDVGPERQVWSRRDDGGWAWATD